MKKFLSTLLFLLTLIAIVVGCLWVSSLYKEHEQKVELERIEIFNKGYTDHIIAAHKSDDIYETYDEINAAMDFLYTLRFDRLRASKTERNDILIWYMDGLSTLSFFKDTLNGDDLNDNNVLILRDIVFETFMSEDKVYVPDDMWLNTIQTGDRDSGAVLGELVPDSFFGESFDSIRQLSIETPLPDGKGVFYLI